VFRGCGLELIVPRNNIVMKILTSIMMSMDLTRIRDVASIGRVVE